MLSISRLPVKWTGALAGLALLAPGAGAQVIEGFEAGIPAGWTVTGSAGTSGVTATVSPTEGSAFAWLNSAGPFGTASGYDGSASNGSRLESAPINLIGGSEISFDFDFMSNDYVPFRDWILVQLLDNVTDAVVATTATGQVNGDSCQSGFQVVPATGNPPPPISPGVVLSPATSNMAQVFTHVGSSSFCGHTGWVTSSLTVPASGAYRLRFIATNLFDSALDVGVAIDNIRYSATANQPPVADAGMDVTIECTTPGGELIALDASGSSDPDGDALTYSWSVPAGVSLDDSASSTPTGTFPLGSHTLILTVTDTAGNTDMDSVTILVQDTTAPSVECTADTELLWPPNHGMVPVTFTVSAWDACTAVGGLSITTSEATSSEADDTADLGDGATVGDVDGQDGYISAVPVPAVVYDAATDTFAAVLDLRAERQGGGAGRTYTFYATVSDPSGNETEVSCSVFVPHSRGKK